ncbi:HNH endonuclease signature motif containing protein [Streptosporangium sp. NPDC051023]|uniref:HNH endonuclease signature motif containing protein n=1 Tax=Streptosporangium sp. NPDC051023 TaxID=3155410 RepID=UPI003450DBF9
MLDVGGDAGDLPHPDDPELLELIREREVREAYRFLYERRENPPTMAEWRQHAGQALGKVDANEQTDRRLRDLRKQFVVETVRRRSSNPVYLLRGRNPVAVDASPISSRMEAEVYAIMGAYCRMCGASPQDGIKLQVDHKIPLSWGGETVLENLQPLCTRHNHGKQAFFETLDAIGAEIRYAASQPTVWHRIGELLKGLHAHGRRTSAELVALVAGEGYGGDPARRLRDLRKPLGWKIKARMHKEGHRTLTEYELISWQPWPLEGPEEAVRRYEQERKRRRRATP